MAVAAECIDTHTWERADQAYPELDRRARVETMRYLGGIAIRGEAQVEYVESEPSEASLLAAIQLARLGDQAALHVLRHNVSTDIAERIYKVAHQTRIPLEVSDGALTQGDMALTDMYGNTLRYAHLNTEMLHRSKTEVKNIFLFQELIRAGVMQDYAALVASPAPFDERTKKDYNFFMDTDTCSLQLLTVEGKDAALETALVAGKATPEGQRHDIVALQTLAAHNGVELATDVSSDMLQYVMLIPKQQVPHGISDVVELYDQAAGGTFYGQASPQQDYQEYAAYCQERNDMFEDTVSKVTQELLARAHEFRTPLDAVRALDKISEKYCLERAKDDHTIDAAVFGEVAARHIEDARFFMDIGDMDRAELSMQHASATAASGSCPLYNGADGGQAGEGSGDSADGSTNEVSAKKWMNCPHCQAKVYDDPCAKILSCNSCMAVVFEGKEWNPSNGGPQKRHADRAARRAQKNKHALSLRKQVRQSEKQKPTPAVSVGA